VKKGKPDKEVLEDISEGRQLLETKPIKFKE
jgi:hypothetical protein